MNMIKEIGTIIWLRIACSLFIYFLFLVCKIKYQVSKIYYIHKTSTHSTDEKYEYSEKKYFISKTVIDFGW